MVNTTEYKKGVQQCKKCHNTFHQSDVKKVKTERYGLEKEEKVCPHCGSKGFGAIDYEVTEEELIYKTGKFYANYNRELRIHMDQVIDEILEEDKKKLKAIQKANRINQQYLLKYKLGA